MFQVILGCTHTNGHVDFKAGIFGILEERVRKLLRSEPIPARENTDCPHRRGAQCNQDCPKAVYGILSGKLSWRKEGAYI